MHDNHYVKKTVYAQVLAPILKAAADDPNDSLEEVPAMNLLLKNAHILPKPRNAPDSAPNPILVRLNMMDVRHKIFKYKKKVLSAPGCPRILEDLTSINSTVLSSLFLNKEIDSAWSLQGAIFYTKASDQSQKKKRYRVYDVFEFLSDDDLRRLKISLPRVPRSRRILESVRRRRRLNSWYFATKVLFMQGNSNIFLFSFFTCVQQV